MRCNPQVIRANARSAALQVVPYSAVSLAGFEGQWKRGYKFYESLKVCERPLGLRTLCATIRKLAPVITDIPASPSCSWAKWATIVWAFASATDADVGVQQIAQSNYRSLRFSGIRVSSMAVNASSGMDARISCFDQSAFPLRKLTQHDVITASRDFHFGTLHPKCLWQTHSVRISRFKYS
jgi:hypothetical protein